MIDNTVMGENGDSSARKSALLLDADDDRYCNELAKLTDALAREVEAEEANVAVLQRALNDHEEINRLLTRKNRYHATPEELTDSASTLHDPTLSVDWLMHDIARLRKELDSATGVIERQRQEDGKGPSTPRSKSLGKLLNRLIEQRLECPSNPFLDPSSLVDANPEDVQLLKEANMIETQDTGHICLIDYASTTDFDTPN